MSQAEEPERLQRAQGGREITVEDVRRLMGASTPHFALQLRNRIRHLIAPLPEGHPVRVEGEREIRRLDRLGFDGERRGAPAEPGLKPMPSISPQSAGRSTQG